VAPIQRQRRRGLHTVHQLRLQQFRTSVLRQSTVKEAVWRCVSRHCSHGFDHRPSINKKLSWCWQQALHV